MFIDAYGNAEANYTVLGLLHDDDVTSDNPFTRSLQPVGSFITHAWELPVSFSCWAIAVHEHTCVCVCVNSTVSQVYDNSLTVNLHWVGWQTIRKSSISCELFCGWFVVVYSELFRSLTVQLERLILRALVVQWVTPSSSDPHQVV